MRLFIHARVWPAMLAVMLGVGATANAQQTESRIVGKVLDQSSTALPGATITVTSTQTGATRTIVSQDDGTFTVTNLRPGNFELKAEMPSFAPETRAVILGAGQTEDLSIQLKVGGVAEQVTVLGESVPVLDLTSAKTGVNVSPEEVKGLPVNGRNFANLMTLATGASSDGNGGWSSVRFNGKSNQQNYLNYDGVDGTYVWDASPGYLNATGSQFRLQTSMESIAEFRVNSGLAPAESGLGAGGNITVISKSGTNRYSGGLFEYRRDDALDSASKYDNRKQPLKLDQFGGSLGGPVVANRTFFFASYERLTQKTGVSFTEAVPSALARNMILNGTPTTTGGGRSADRTRAVAPLLAGFPVGTTPTANQFLDLATLDSEADQKETAVSFRLDQVINNRHSFYLRYLLSDGELDTPDRTVTPRRVQATQRPQNFILNFQSILGAAVNELKVGYNKPTNDFTAFSATPGYDPTQVSLTGSVNSSSVDARGTTGIARSGLLLRATSAASTEGAGFRPSSLSIANALTWSNGAHTWKGGLEYRYLQSEFQFLGSTEIVFNSIQEFIDNRPASIRISENSPFFKPEQYYLLGFLQDSWRVNNRLTLELGVRYDFYSVVKEAQGRAKPFFIEENDFAPEGSAFYNPDKNNVAPRLSAAYRLDDKTVVRAGFGLFYGPGQFEDRIQPIENYINRLRANQDANNTLQYPRTQLPTILSIRGYTHERPDEYNIQYGTSVSRELPGQVNFTIGYTGSRGKDMFIRGVANTLDPVTRVRPVPSYGQIDYKTSGCVDGLVINGNPISGCGRATYNALQLSATRRFRAGFTGGFQYQYSRNEGTTQGSNEAATAQNTFDYNSEFGTNPQDIPHTFNGSVVYLIPGDGFWTGGWRVGGILNARTGVPINPVITRSDTATVNGATVISIPGGNDRGTQRPDLVPGVDPYLKDGVRWLNPAAFATPMPGTFGNMPRNFLRGPGFWQFDLTLSKELRLPASQSVIIRAEIFNLTNRLNYENPAASLSSSTAGVPFTDATAGTFGYMLGPLNRSVGLGTARQTQISVRYSF